MKQVYLLTGRPGMGKTSLIKEIVSGVGGRAGGFYTEEIREQGVRQGFRLVTLDGQDAILSHTNIGGPYRVGKYGVDIESLERVGVTALRKAAEQCDLVVVDEIGKMELLSASFKQTVWEIVRSGKKVLGTIMLSTDPWTDDIKRQPQVSLVTVTRTNHREVLMELRQWLNLSAG